MARSKFTARKSTGGKGPRKQCGGGSGSARRSAPPSAIGLKPPSDYSSSDESVSNDEQKRIDDQVATGGQNDGDRLDSTGQLKSTEAEQPDTLDLCDSNDKPAKRLKTTESNQINSTDELKTLEDSEKQLVLGIDIGEKWFKPEDIKVSIVDNHLEISANREEKTDRWFVERRYSGKFVLPGNLIEEEMSYRVDDPGVLKITIPKSPKTVIDLTSDEMPVENDGQ